MQDKCIHCKGFCCQYVTVDLEDPEDWEDFDEIRWHLLHRDVFIYKVDEKEGWRIEFKTPCVYLDVEHNACKKYPHRPDVCRAYTTDECGGLEEMSSEGCEAFFAKEQDLRDYLAKNKPEISKLVFPDQKEEVT